MNERLDILTEDVEGKMMVRRTSGASRFTIYKISEIMGMRTMEKVTSKR